MALNAIYGIDLGTRVLGDCVRPVSTESRLLCLNQESERITPSVVLFDGDSIIVGNTAKESAKIEPHRVVSASSSI